MLWSIRFWSLLTIMTLVALPAAALTDDPFWDEDEVAEEVTPGAGTGGGPYMVWFPHEFGNVNTILKGDSHIGIPDLDLYWGGAGWFSISSGKHLHVALGGGGFSGQTEAQEGGKLSRWNLTGGYFSIKGIYPVHRNLYLEAGIDLGGGSSELWVERTVTSTGVIEVYLQGDRNFLLLRPSLGLEVRLSPWVGILVNGGYSLSSGDWSLEGEQDLIDKLDFGSGDDLYASVMVRFGI